MKQIRFILTALIAVFLFTNSVKAQTNNATKIVGRWYTENKEITIQIYTIDNKFYGRIMGLKDVTDRNEMIKITDKNNPDPLMQERPLMGKIVMNELVFNGKDLWDSGTYYDFKTGKTYSCKISVESEDKLKVQMGGIEKPTYWTKVK